MKTKIFCSVCGCVLKNETCPRCPGELKDRGLVVLILSVIFVIVKECVFSQ